MTTPANNRPAMTMREIRDQLGHARPDPAPAVWIDGDPLMEAMAAAVYEQCATHPEQALTVDDPRTIAAVAAAVARQVLGTPTTDPAPASAPAAPADRATVLLDQRAAALRALSSSSFSQEEFAARELTEAADRLRRLADEAQPTEAEAHACDNCDGIDPDTCFNNPHRPPEQCPAAEFEDYGQQCQKPVGHHLHTFEEQPVAAEGDDPICGDRYDGEACELEPEHPGAHCAGTLCWDYGRAPATAATEKPFPLPGPPCIPDHSLPIHCPGCATAATEEPQP